MTLIHFKNWKNSHTRLLKKAWYLSITYISAPNVKQFKTFKQFVDIVDIIVKKGKLTRQNQELFLIELIPTAA